MPLPESYVVHNVQRGLRRLLLCPWDLRPRLAPGPPHASLRDSEPAHRELLLVWLDEAAEAAETGANWWVDVVDRRAEREGDFRQGLLKAFGDRPAGPAAHGAVVSAVRGAWLSCAAINAGLPEARRVPSQDLLLRWPAEVGRAEALPVLSAMPYWPLGLDAEGNWC